MSRRSRIGESQLGRLAAAQALIPVAPAVAVAAVAQQVAHIGRVCQPPRLAMRRTMRYLGTAALAALLLAPAGCGGGQTLTAEEFVTRINRQGVELRLGEPLTTEEEGKELYAIELEPLGRPRVDSEGDAVHAAGSLSVYDEDSGADPEYETCRQAADLLCYRLANVVIVLEGGGIEADQLGVAMQNLAGE